MLSGSSYPKRERLQIKRGKYKLVVWVEECGLPLTPLMKKAPALIHM